MFMFALCTSWSDLKSPRQTSKAPLSQRALYGRALCSGPPFNDALIRQLPPK